MQKIAIIDLDSVCYSIGNGVKLLDDQGNPIKVPGKGSNMVFSYREKTLEELKEAADFYMKQIFDQGEFTHFIGYMKGVETTTFRLLANPDYKGNRSKEPPGWWEFVQNDLFTRYNAKYVHDIEVDDAVNITRLKLKDSYIVAIDGDLLGLEGKHYNWRTSTWSKVTADEASWKFWSDMITGQVGDNIKGIPGKGPAFVEKLFESQIRSDTVQADCVFNAYIKHFGEYQGIKEFHRNYISLKILDSHPTFTIPEPTPVNIKQTTDIEKLFN